MQPDMTFLQSLKAGDKVGVCTSHHGTSYCIETVERVTPTQIVLPYGYKFRKADGSLIGPRERGSCASVTLQECTPELEASIARARKHQTLLCWFRGYDWKVFSVEALEELAEIVQKKADNQ